MSIVTPQHDQIQSILGASSLAHYTLQDTTRYFFEGQEVICLGIYTDADVGQVGVFGQWQGREHDKPQIPSVRIRACTNVFFVRSAVSEEYVQYGGNNVLIHVQVKESKSRYTQQGMTLQLEEITFCIKRNMGFYNSVG